MKAAKCNICGRYRRWSDVVTVDYSDGYPAGSDIVEECKTCTAPTNIKDHSA